MRSQAFLFIAALVVISFGLSPTVTAAEKPQPRVVACTWIKTINQLQAMRNNLAATYCLANDIDASAKANFIPIGTGAAPFTGRFYGHGHVIRNLTITSSRELLGLFGYTDQAVIQDVGLVDVSISGPGPSALGGLVGNAEATSGTSTVARVFVTGKISCTHAECKPGGIAGIIGANTTLTESSSAADITAATSSEAGGVVGRLFGTLSRTFASGSVSCGSSCFAGGLVGRSEGNVLASYATGTIHASDDSDVGGAIGFAENGAVVQRSYATGPVSADPDASAGGLIGLLSNSTVTESYAAGPVSGGTAGRVGGLVGLLSTDTGKTSTITESYAVGAVTAPAGTTTVGGLVGAKAGTGMVADDFAYWDIDTTGQSSIGVGTARSTADMRSGMVPCCLPGRGNPWAVTSTLSYPFLDDFDIDFASPLATLVHASKVFIFLPIEQLDASQYLVAPAHADAADLAAVYTMIARAVGLTDNDTRLKDVKIDRFFWDDTTQTAIWTGPVRTYAALGTLTAIAGSTPLDATNVIGKMNAQKLVILRGSYKKSDGSVGTHWVLGTLYTKAADDSVSTVVANDPFTGKQIEIDPETKKVLSPANFPLANFKVNGFQPVVLK